MSMYYCLIAGLPALMPDDRKPAYSVAGFKAELKQVLSEQDQALADWFFLQYDHRNLLSCLRGDDGRFDSRGVYTEEELREICGLLKSEDRVPAGLSVPAYLVDFIRAYHKRFESDDPEPEMRLWEDRLSSLYYQAALQCRNEFLASWFELNLNIGNVMTVCNCRKYRLDKEDYIIGHTGIAALLRQSGLRDLNPGNSPDYIQELIRITEEEDFMMREKRVDLLRWNWLEENTFFKTFGIESVLAYLLRLEMTERWQALDEQQGEQTFRKLVMDMKRESLDTLEEFKENNK